MTETIFKKMEAEHTTDKLERDQKLDQPNCYFSFVFKVTALVAAIFQVATTIAQIKIVRKIKRQEKNNHSSKNG